MSGVQAAFSPVLTDSLSKVSVRPYMTYETDEQRQQRIVQEALKARELEAYVASLTAAGAFDGDNQAESDELLDYKISDQFDNGVKEKARVAESSATKAWAAWEQAAGLIVKTTLLPRVLRNSTSSAVPSDYVASLEGIIRALSSANPPADLRQRVGIFSLIGRQLWSVAVADSGTSFTVGHSLFEDKCVSREARAGLALELLHDSNDSGQQVADLLASISIPAVEGSVGMGNPRTKEARLAYASTLTLVSQTKLANVFDAILGATFLQHKAICPACTACCFWLVFLG